MSAIDSKLEETRRRLLDLTRRNRLLNHKPRPPGSLRIVDEVAVEVFRILVLSGHRMNFLALEEGPAHLQSMVGEGAADQLSASEPDPSESSPTLSLAPLEREGAAVARYTDNRLQTALEGEKLQRTLLYLAREAASALEERGANILFLVLGMVEWRDSGSDGVASYAPVLFVPVDLTRKNVNSRHSISKLDDDLFTNPCLVELCARQFGFEFPVFDPSDEGADLAGYFSTVASTLATLSGWSFTPEIHIGLFSFAKLLMYKDLDSTRWPADSPLSSHPLIQTLSGIRPLVDNDAHAIPDPSTLDDTVPPDDCYQVLDADSSQQSAILAAKNGASAVIEGPPGTGKSQTIANIIAECMSEGKTVLFVAEKAAALEVVKRRLEAVELGRFVLELHSRKASKRAVLEDLQRSLVADDGPGSPPSQTGDDLDIARMRLNRYARELHAPTGAIGISVFDAITNLAAVGDAPAAACTLPNPIDWNQTTLSDAVDMIDLVDRRLERVGALDDHPWRGVLLSSLGYEGRQEIRGCGAAVESAWSRLLDAMAALVALLDAPKPQTVDQIEDLASACSVVAAASPEIADILEDRGWNRRDPGFLDWMEAGRARQALHALWANVFAAEAETVAWDDVVDRRRKHRDSWLRYLSPNFYRDNALVKKYCLESRRPSLGEQVDLLERIVECRRLRQRIEAQEVAHRRIFGRLWAGIDGDWERLGRFADAAYFIHAAVERGTLTLRGVAAGLASGRGPEVEAAVRTVRRALAEARDVVERWCTVLHSTPPALFGAEWDGIEVELARSRVERSLAAFDTLQDWVDLQAVIQRTQSHAVRPFVDWALGPTSRDARGKLVNAFKRLFYTLWIERALDMHPSLGEFFGDDHDLLVEKFRTLDRAWLQSSKRRLASLVRARRPDMRRMASRDSKLGIVQAEIRKQRNIMPLRKLFSVAGEVIQSIKPCFMMSPVSVAQYLAPGGIHFDLVIFDEASQVEPADAYGAIARGRQILLVGDERQLPPTSFFARIEGDVEYSSSDDPQFSATDLESILAVGAVQFPSIRLRWHYRSRHASLIEFSNDQFYSDAPLRVFPSPHTGRDELGLVFRHVENGVYLRGKGQYNPIESATVAAEVVRHAQELPHLSLGVGAFSVAQQRAIQDDIERLRREAADQRLEAFFASHADEPFFVKNLETIQGDERDVIFLSVGYGPDTDGKLSLNFGPLNREGGWRRLNVLVTRAKQRCVLFASFRADEFNVSGSKARGVQALKDYLYFAEYGRMPNISTTGRDHDSPFEASVATELRNRGWDVHAQVGSAGFSIDLAVVDPDFPGRYLLGIECDGATYHSSATARDRDRLRQAVLENLGWTLFRIWSTDWFKRKNRVLETLVSRLEDLRARERMADRSATQTADAASADEKDETDDRAADEGFAEFTLPRGVVAYERAPLGNLGDLDTLARLRGPAIADVLATIVRAESPIHRDEVERVLAAAYQTRVSKRCHEAFAIGLAALLAHDEFAERGDFVWYGAVDAVSVRWRAGDCPVTKSELIAPEEFERAVRLTVENEFGMRRAALVASTARLMGFARSGPTLNERIEAAVGVLLARGDLEIDHHEHIVAASER